MSSAVSRVPAADAQAARKHFAALLEFETDCWDVNHAIENNRQDFVLLDVRSEDLYTSNHLPQAVSMPHWKITNESIAPYGPDTLFVVYCAGPHCNGADWGAFKLSELGVKVKKMIGGVTGWLDEGFELTRKAPDKIPPMSV